MCEDDGALASQVGPVGADWHLEGLRRIYGASMLTALMMPDDRPVMARRCERGKGEFRCKACGEDALLVKGDIRIHHFRHRPKHTLCDQERGETEAHRACKEAIYGALWGKDGVAELELEKRIGSNIADVFAMINGFPVAIEVQRSTLSVDSIRQRTMDYHRSRVFVLWLGLLREENCFDGYRPAAWERWCHAAYSGRMYYWVSSDEIQPIHFAGHKEHVRRTSWPGAAGREYAAGGYDKYSKSLRNPDHGARVKISEEFRPIRRSEWSGGTVHVPSCSLFVDRQAAWWK